MRDSVLGKVSTRFVEGDERIDIRVRGDEQILATIEDVYDLVVNPEAEKPVPLRSIARIEEVRGPAEIRRIGNSRAVLVTAASAGLDLGGLNQRIEASLADLVTPGDVVVEIGGQKREMDEGIRSLRFALLLAIFLVYVVMASQFESLLQPLIILFSVPLAGVGVVLALDLLDIPLSVVVFIGLILLAGIVVNNAIVLVDRINAKRREGMSQIDAILEAGRARLRPILMTTATTVLGLLPLTGWLEGLPLIGSLGAGEGAEMRAPDGRHRDHGLRRRLRSAGADRTRLAGLDLRQAGVLARRECTGRHGPPQAARGRHLSLADHRFAGDRRVDGLPAAVLRNSGARAIRG